MDRLGLKKPPLVETPLTPTQIIGRHNMELFVEHLRICFNENNGDFPNSRLNKEFGKDTRAKIAKVLTELRENGFSPDGVDDTGKIIWKIGVKSGVQVIFENGLESEKSKNNHIKESRNGYRKMVRRRDIEPVEPWEFDPADCY